MRPFKKGFVTKCASYGIPKDAAKELFDKIASTIPFGNEYVGWNPLGAKQLSVPLTNLDAAKPVAGLVEQVAAAHPEQALQSGGRAMNMLHGGMSLAKAHPRTAAGLGLSLLGAGAYGLSGGGSPAPAHIPAPANIPAPAPTPPPAPTPKVTPAPLPKDAPGVDWSSYAGPAALGGLGGAGLGYGIGNLAGNTDAERQRYGMLGAGLGGLAGAAGVPLAMHYWGK
jgi:hypothetical protein